MVRLTKSEARAIAESQGYAVERTTMEIFTIRGPSFPHGLPQGGFWNETAAWKAAAAMATAEV